jgi:hypothetical protein
LYGNMRLDMASVSKRRRDEDEVDEEECDAKGCQQIDCERCWSPGEYGRLDCDGGARSVVSPTKRHRGQTNCVGRDCQQLNCTSCYQPDLNIASQSPIPYTEMVDQLDPKALREIVKLLAADSPSSQDLIRMVYEQGTCRSKVETANFRGYTADVAAIFSSRSERYSTYGKAYADVRACVNAIGQQVGPQSSYSIKKSALESLHDITLSILRAEACRQAIEVRREFERDDCIPQLMLQIVRSMSTEEQAKVGAEFTLYGSTLIKSLEYVHEKAVETYIAGFYDFSLVLEILRT